MVGRTRIASRQVKAYRGVARGRPLRSRTHFIARDSRTRRTAIAASPAADSNGRLCDQPGEATERRVRIVSGHEVPGARAGVAVVLLAFASRGIQRYRASDDALE